MTENALSATLVGREQEMGVIFNRVRDAQAGEPSVVLLSGEAGVGKTALAHYARSIAAQFGYTVVGGRCSPRLHAPLMPLVDTVLSVAIRRLESEHALVNHRSILEQVASPSSESTLLTSHTHVARVAQALTAGLSLESYAQPILLFVDDIQWADELTIGFLTHLTGRISDGLEWQTPQIAVVLTQRNTADAAFPDQIFSIARDPTTTTIDLEGLDRQDSASLAERLIGSALPGRVRDELHRVTRGNPLFIETIVANHPREDLIEGLATNIGPIVPRTVRDEIALRLDRVSTHDNDLLDTIACLERRFSLGDITKIVDIPDREIEERLDGLCGEHVLTYRSGHYQFAHGLYRDVLQSEIPPNRRSRIHLAIFESFRSDPDRTRQLGYHLEHAVDRLPRDDIVEYALQAASIASNGSDWISTARYAEMALDAIGDDEHPGRIVSALVAGKARSRLGDNADALAHLEGILEVVESDDDPMAELQTHVELINLTSQRMGAVDPVRIERVKQLVSEIHESNPVLAAEAEATVANSMWNIASLAEVGSIDALFEEATAMARNALVLGAQHDAAAPIGYATTTLVAAGWSRLDVDIALADNRRSFESVDKPSADPNFRVGTLRTLALMESWVGNFDEAERLCEHGLHLTHKHQLTSHEGFLLSVMASINAARGALAEALAQARRSIMLDGRRNPWTLPISLPIYAAITSYVGNHDELADTLAQHGPLLGSAALPELIDCSRRAIEGDCEQASVRAHEVLDAVEDAQLTNVTSGSTLSELLRLAELTNDPSLAEVVIEPLATLRNANLVYLPSAISLSDRMRASAQRIAGDPEWVTTMDSALGQAIDLDAHAEIVRASASLLTEPDLSRYSVPGLRTLHNESMARTSFSGTGASMSSHGGIERPLVRRPSTLMFIDVCNSTRLTRELGDLAYLDRQRKALAGARAAIVGESGRVVLGLNAGDGLLATFEGAIAAARAARKVHRAARDADLEVRVGIHHGDIVAESGNVYGHNVNVAARVCDAAEANTTMVTNEVVSLLTGATSVQLVDKGEYSLKGLNETTRLAQIIAVSEE
jgi:class 3 adenylate cyclase